MSSYLKCLRHYVDFSGRASRTEFWMFVLFNVLIAFVLRGVDHAAHLTYNHGTQGILHTIYSVAVFLPGLAVAVRRLHDIGKSGLHLFVALVPCVGAFILLYWYVLDSQPGANAYGSNPKG